METGYKKICPNCQAENIGSARYCARCGTPLQETDPQNDPFGDSFELGSIDGISGGDMTTYIGRKAPGILPKFFAISADRTAFCWPAAVWGIVFGPLGVAVWLFWRKIFKPAWAFLIIAVLLAYLPFVGFCLSDPPGVKETYREQYAQLQKEEQFAEKEDGIAEMTAMNNAYQIFIQNFAEFQQKPIFRYTTIAFELLAALVGGLFGYVWYKNSAVRRIKVYRRNNLDPRYYQLGLMKQGSTSGGFAVLAFVLYSVILSIGMTFYFLYH